MKSNAETQITIIDDFFRIASEAKELITLCSIEAEKTFKDYIEMTHLSNKKAPNFFELLPTTVGKRFKLLRMSPYDLFHSQTFKKELKKRGIPDKPFLIKGSFDMEEEHLEYVEVLLNDLNDPDIDTRGFQQILFLCRSNSSVFIGQRDYELTRSCIFDTRYGFKDRKHFNESLDILGINSQFKELLYQHLEPLDTVDYHHCSYCGRPIKKGIEKNLSCVHYYCKEKNRINASKLTKVKGVKLIWNKAFYRSVIIPTFLENAILELILKKFPNAVVTKFPNIERDGDLLVELGDVRFLIDAKDYRNWNRLIDYLKGERGRKLKPNTIIVTNNHISEGFIDKELESRKIHIVKLKNLGRYLEKRLSPVQTELF